MLFRRVGVIATVGMDLQAGLGLGNHLVTEVTELWGVRRSLGSRLVVMVVIGGHLSRVLNPRKCRLR